MHNRKRLFTTIISLIVLLGFLATSLIGYYVAKDSIAERLQQEMLPLTSDNIYSEIQRDLLQPLLISSLMANDVFVFDWVNEGEQDPEKMQRYLSQIQDKYDTITAFFVSESTRHYYHPKGIIKQVDENDPDDGWFFRARSMKNKYEINIDQDTADRKRLSIFVNYQVADKQGKFIGVIGVGLSMASVIELIENYQKRYGREIYFVDRQGEVMLQSSEYSEDIHLQNKTGLDKLFTRILTTPSASVSFPAKNGNTIYLNSRLVPEFDWFLIVEQINDPASERIETALIINILVSLAISVVVLLTAHLALRGYQRRLEAMATQDKLTGAASRQVFDVLFKQAVSRAKRKHQALSVILIDIDHFKNINDSYGHHYGDQVLAATARIISSHVRDDDVLCRWGGEEFLLLLNSCSRERAVEIAETIRQSVKSHPFQYGKENLSITISAGVAEYQRDELMTSLIERSDQALYQAKNDGRDLVRQLR
ncbi:sensor domain-containing diguanylate cyclase [Methylophaga sp. OBS4]|uniref:sensor domain-containing diguanylate cyclase n=1 Tax=Methylophaga sp. OBS4 TaxID=2991935 RepID=UPI0022529B6C|nr:sensor domain-containing diguanylate cyclase [Methylophaga sp. OBS4]MCX4186958.1 diguanylate cyclase [Methylophaga sp. OBS4]